jgi:hypothetical protein
MRAFRAFHRDQTTACQIMYNPFLLFLQLKGKQNDSKEEHKSNGCANCSPNHFPISDHTDNAKLQVPNRCTSVSLSPGHHTQFGFVIKPGMPLRNKLTLVGNLCKINCQENTINFYTINM